MDWNNINAKYFFLRKDNLKQLRWSCLSCWYVWFDIDFFMNLVYFMQAFERRKIFYLFPLFTTWSYLSTVYYYYYYYYYYYVINIYGRNTRLHAPGLLISNSSFSFCFFLRHGNSNRSEKFVVKLKSELLLKFAYPAYRIIVSSYN